VPALAHRVTLRPELWVRQVSSDEVVTKLLATVPTPKTDPAARARPGQARPGQARPGQASPGQASRDQARAVTG
jgi:MoxR-like ATPase